LGEKHGGKLKLYLLLILMIMGMERVEYNKVRRLLRDGRLVGNSRMSIMG